MFQALPDLYFRLDSEGTILDRKVGRAGDLYAPPQLFLGERLQDVLPPRVGHRFEDAIGRVLETTTLASIEYCLTIQGRDQIFEARLLPFLQKQIVVVVRNVTERRRAEEERERLLAEVRQRNQQLEASNLRERELALETERRAVELDCTIASIADGLITFDSQGQILHMNPAAERMLGYSEEQRKLPLADQVTLLRFETPEGKPIRLEELPPMRALRGETTRGLVVVVHPPNGRTLWLSTSAAPIW